MSQVIGVDPPAGPGVRPVLAALFVASGFSALAYQVVLSRYAQLIVGGTAFAVSALLVAFMLGMSSRRPPLEAGGRTERNTLSGSTPWLKRPSACTASAFPFLFPPSSRPCI